MNIKECPVVLIASVTIVTGLACSLFAFGAVSFMF